MKKNGLILLTISGLIAFVVSIATTKGIVFVSFLIIAAIIFVVGSIMSAKTSKHDNERIDRLEKNSIGAVHYVELNEKVKLPEEIVEQLKNKKE